MHESAKGVASPRNQLNLLNEIGRPVIGAAFFDSGLQGKAVAHPRNHLILGRVAFIERPDFVCGERQDSGEIAEQV